jgi:hypothetical protein
MSSKAGGRQGLLVSIEASISSKQPETSPVHQGDSAASDVACEFIEQKVLYSRDTKGEEGYRILLDDRRASGELPASLITKSLCNFPIRVWQAG